MSKIPIAEEIQEYDGEVFQAVAVKSIANRIGEWIFGPSKMELIDEDPYSTSVMLYGANREKIIMIRNTVYRLRLLKSIGDWHRYQMVEAGVVLKIPRGTVLLPTSEIVRINWRNLTAVTHT